MASSVACSPRRVAFPIRIQVRLDWIGFVCLFLYLCLLVCLLSCDSLRVSLVCFACLASLRFSLLYFALLLARVQQTVPRSTISTTSTATTTERTRAGYMGEMWSRRVVNSLSCLVSQLAVAQLMLVQARLETRQEAPVLHQLTTEAAPTIGNCTRYHYQSILFIPSTVCYRLIEHTCEGKVWNVLTYETLTLIIVRKSQTRDCTSLSIHF